MLKRTDKQCGNSKCKISQKQKLEGVKKTIIYSQKVLTFFFIQKSLFQKEGNRKCLKCQASIHEAGI